MTMPARAPRDEYVEDGVQTVFPIGFKFIAAADIRVVRINADGDETLLAQPIDYTVQGGNYDIGQITAADPGTAGDTIRIDRLTDQVQPLDYIAGDDFPAESHEHGLDRSMMLIQELRRDTLTRADVRALIAEMLKAGAGIDLELNGDGDELTIINTYNAAFIRATIAEALQAGSGIEISYDAGTGRITISSTATGVGSLADFLMLSGDQQGGGSSGTGDGSFNEQVRDIIAAALVGDGIEVQVDDPGNTITLLNLISAETIRDIIAAALVGAAGISVTNDDGGDQIIIDGSGISAGGVTLEQVRDMLVATLQEGTLIEIVHDDGGDTITINTTALDPSYKGLVPTTKNAAFSFADANNGRALDLTGAGTYVGTIEPNADVALSPGWAVVLRNSGTAAKTIARGAGVALYKNGATASADAVLAPGGIATLQRWAADVFTISGPGVS